MKLRLLPWSWWKTAATALLTGFSLASWKEVRLGGVFTQGIITEAKGKMEGQAPLEAARRRIEAWNRQTDELGYHQREAFFNSPKFRNAIAQITSVAEIQALLAEFEDKSAQASSVLRERWVTLDVNSVLLMLARKGADLGGDSHVWAETLATTWAAGHSTEEVLAKIEPLIQLARRLAEAGVDFYEGSLPGAHGLSPEAARGMAPDLRERLLREHSSLLGASVWGLTAAWAEANPEAARQWVTGLPAGRCREFAEYGLSIGLVTSDPMQAITYAKKLSEGSLDAVLRSQGLTALFLKVGPTKGLDEFSNLIKDATENQQTMFLEALGPQWTGDPEILRSWVKNLPYHQRKQARLAADYLNPIHLALNAAETDEDLVAVARSQPSALLQAGTAEIALKVVDHTTPVPILAELLNLAAQVPDSQELAEATALPLSVSRSFSGLPYLTTAKITELSTQLSPAALNDFLYTQIPWFSSQAPATASALLYEHRHLPQLESLVDGLARDWVASDPEALRAWADTMPPALQQIAIKPLAEEEASWTTEVTPR